MIRRTFLILIGMLGLGLIAIFSIEPSFMRRIMYRIQNLFTSPVKLPPNTEKEKVDLPSEGYGISVEMALNSRCCCDYDGNPKRFHWGMFDKTKKLSHEHVKQIIQLARIPRFTARRLEIQSEDNMLTFIAENLSSRPLRDWVMVESGMQQQAVGLVCAALGVGMVFSSLGEDGVPISDKDYATIKVGMDAMKPTYNGSFWSSSAPASPKPWLRGNLPDPLRDGNKPFISALDGLQVANKTGKSATDGTISQLLWAARGRTPHFYKSRPWGMTVPTAGGRQYISAIHLISDCRLYSYTNWYRNRPTHSLELLDEIPEDVYNELTRLFPGYNSFIVLAKNENFARALWEVGYELLNLLLQASSLNISFQAILLDEKQKSSVGRAGVRDPVAILAI